MLRSGIQAWSVTSVKIHNARVRGVNPSGSLRPPANSAAKKTSGADVLMDRMARMPPRPQKEKRRWATLADEQKREVLGRLGAKAKPRRRRRWKRTLRNKSSAPEKRPRTSVGCAFQTLRD